MLQSIYRIWVLSCFVLFSVQVSASVVPPPNDKQCNANLLAMTYPDSCPTWDIDTVTIIGDNFGATSDTLPSFFFNCQSGGNTPANPVADVWYKFVATAERLAVIVSGLNTNAITLYLRQNTCMGLIPINCAVNPLGAAIIYCDVMLPGEVYYLQVSGGTSVDQAQFTMKFLWQHPCDDCVQNGKLTANPPPVHGFYHPGDTVEFTYVIKGYKPYGMDLLHGLSPDFTGGGWDMASFTPITSPPTQPASGVGTWAWYNGIPDMNSNPVNGFFYDGPPLQNGDPKDNKGDDGNFFSQWVFRWKIRTNPICTGADDLSMNIYHYSDYETGSGTNPSCKNDADYHFKATLNCCPGPDVTEIAASCSNTPNGSAIINIPSLPGPYSCLVYDQTGFQVYSSTASPSSVFNVTSLSQGNYVTLVFNGSCWSSQQFHITSTMEFTPLQTAFGCGNTCNSAAIMQGQTGNYTFNWQPSNQTGPSANNLCQGTHTIIVNNTSLGCVDSFFLAINNYPPDIPFFVYTPPDAPNYCSFDTINPTPYFIAQPGGTFSWTGPPGNIDPVTGEIFLFPFINGGTYTVTYTTAGPCTATRTDSLFFAQSPPSPLISGPTSFCVDQQPITLAATNTPAFSLLVWDLLNDFSPPSMSSPVILSGLPVGIDTLATVFYDINTQCYSFPSFFPFTIFDIPIVSAGMDTTICPGFSTTLNGSGGPGYFWTPSGGLSNPNVQYPIASVSTTTTYTLTVVDVNGCQATDLVTIFVSNTGNCDTLIVWNGISPNGDGYNESWYLEGMDRYRENNVQIFNRWGDKVWQTKDYNNLTNYWDGKNQSGAELPAGTYFFVIQYPPDVTRSGWVEITR